MIADGARPRITSRARVRFDRRSGRHVLLYPERGLVLSATAAEIVEHCRGEETVVQIAVALAERYDAPRETIDAEVRRFLEALFARGLLEIE